MYFNEIISTDVLVIGSGGAGLCAAISARKEGADVLVVGKARPGRSNNTAVSGGVFAVVTGAKNTGDSHELHIRDTLVAGRNINRLDMVQTMVEGALEQTENLVRYGVRLQKKGDDYWVIHVPGHSVPRHLFSKNSFGTDFTIPIAKYAGDKNIRFLSGVFVERLLRGKNGRIAGALVIDKNKNQLIIIRSKAVVLASGGAGRIFSRNNNAPGTTGDGYCLAFRLGVPLVDMEFVQFYPTLLYEPSLPKSLVAYEVFIFRGGAKLFNSKGEDIILRHNLVDPASLTRDALAIAMVTEIREGRGVNGGVWLDLSFIPPKKLELYRRFVHKSLKGRLRFIVSPGVHHFMGGLSVSNKGETEIDGLFSAGEVNGGMHGANRLGGNALTEAWVYGNLTGILAAQYSKESKSPVIEENFEPIENEIKLDLEQKGELPLQNILQEIKDLMWEKAGIIRTEELLMELIRDIDNIKKRLNKCRVENLKDFIRKSEIKNMLLIGEITARSAIERKESRGSHFRLDFPREGGDDWIKNIFVKPCDYGLE